MSKYKIAGPEIDLEAEDVRDNQGRRITNEYAEQAAEDALTKVRTGRPSLSGNSAHSPAVSFRVPEQLGQRASEIAEREGKSLSQLGREALEYYLAGKA